MNRSSRVEQRLSELGISLPVQSSPPPEASITFRPIRRAGNLLSLSGNGPLRDGQITCRGKVGQEVSVEEAYQAARLTGLNLLAVLNAELGDLDRISAWVKVLGFINSAPGFNQQPDVLNGFSDLIVEIFGEEIGGHARSAVGIAELPWDICVEIEAIVEVT